MELCKLRLSTRIPHSHPLTTLAGVDPGEGELPQYVLPLPTH